MEPPVSPPERDMTTCETCDGAGDYILYEHGEITFDGQCGECDGTGQVRVIETDNRAMPDNWLDVL